jgi:pimeloyl-ACP methyl ester carboxylesterase
LWEGNQTTSDDTAPVQTRTGKENDMTLTAIVVGVLLGLVLVSYLVEALRRAPVAPEHLAWAPEIPVRFATVNGLRIRYIVAGQGPPLVLLHTLRTQLDIFQKVIPDLAREFTVYAPDYPGHGWSDIPQADYSPEFFTRFTADFLEALQIQDALVVGVSIGASLPLLMAAGENPRIRAIVAINPYDYGRRGIDRANAVAKVLFSLAPIPILGDTVMRLRNRVVEGKVLDGGVANPGTIPRVFREEVFRVGERPGHYRAFLSLIRHMPLWRETRVAYGRIKVPVLLIYGDRDWSREAERQANLRAIPGARLVVVENAGHFLPLDQPQAVIRHIRGFAREVRAPGLVSS